MKPADISNFLQTAWYEKTGLVTSIVFATVTVALVFHESAKHLYILLIISYIIIGLMWWWTRQPPKTPKNKIGFLVSIACTDDLLSQKLQEDFVRPLRNLIKSGQTGQAFHFMNLPQFLARQVEDTDQAMLIRSRTQADFMLYGNVRQRKIDGKDHHIMSLDGLVMYKPVLGHTNSNFIREFSELLPRKLHINTENDFLSFQFTSEWTDVVARYVIGIASILSKDLAYAEELLNDAFQRLQTKNRKFPAFSKLQWDTTAYFRDISITNKRTTRWLGRNTCSSNMG